MNSNEKNKYKIIDVVKKIVVANNLTSVEVKDFKRKYQQKADIRTVPVGFDTETVIRERGSK